MLGTDGEYCGRDASNKRGDQQLVDDGWVANDRTTRVDIPQISNSVSTLSRQIRMTRRSEVVDAEAELLGQREMGRIIGESLI